VTPQSCRYPVSPHIMPISEQNKSTIDASPRRGVSSAGFLTGWSGILPCAQNEGACHSERRSRSPERSERGRISHALQRSRGRLPFWELLEHHQVSHGKLSNAVGTGSGACPYSQEWVQALSRMGARHLSLLLDSASQMLRNARHDDSWSEEQGRFQAQSRLIVQNAFPPV